MKLTPKRREVLSAAKAGQVRREMFMSRWVHTITTRYAWVLRGVCVDRQVEWLIGAGLAVSARGALRPGFEGVDEIRVAMHGGRLPSRLEPTPAGLAALEGA